MSLEYVFVVLVACVTIVFLALYRRADRKLMTVKDSNCPKISVIVPAHNAGRFLGKCLLSLKASSYSNKEIIVVNDCSTDNTENILKGFAGIKILKNEKRMGKAESLNRGAEIASGKLFLFLDADTFVEKDAISCLVSSYGSYNKTEGMIGFVSPSYRLIKGQGVFAKLAHIEQSIHQFLIKIQMNTGSILSIRGCCLLVNKSAFENVGGFSNNILEDGDFAAKIAKAGYRMKYEPRAFVETDEPDNVKSLFRTRKRYGKGGLFCVLNYPKHFILSKQSALSVYPHALVILVSIIYSLFNLPVSSGIFHYLMNGGLYAASAAGFVGLASTISLFLCGSAIALKSIKKSSVAILFLPYIFLYLPFATIGYANGALDGIVDKIKEQGELKLRDW